MTQPAPLTPPAQTAPLGEWLQWLEGIHPVAVDMGLARVSEVADRLHLRPVEKPLVLVGGTNGKGSTVAMLSSIYQAAGYCVGAYSSPHIHDFRERICVDGQMADATSIVQALAFVETGRAPQTLTYFEYTTLAAMRVFQQSNCDVYIMEVGLGGRLDATNLWDADCSVITSIALDHQDYLGSDISVIATEKAAIGRSGKLLIVGDVEPPQSLHEYADAQDIHVEHIGKRSLSKLPLTALQGDHQRRNAGCAVAVVEALHPSLPVSPTTIEKGLSDVRLAARFETLEAQGVTFILDVAHNPAGASALCEAWQSRYPDHRAQCLFACLTDKDIAGLVAALDPVVDAWHCLDLSVPRAIPVQQLVSDVQDKTGKTVSGYSNTDSACREAIAGALQASQLVLVAGSFHTIAAARDAIHALESSKLSS